MLDTVLPQKLPGVSGPHGETPPRMWVRMSIDQTTFSRTRQSYELVRIITVNEPVSVLRVTVRVDAYVEQSRALVERFNGTRWTEVVTRPGSASHGAMPSYASRDDDTCRRAAREIAEPLIDFAARTIAKVHGV
ncbi:hypothetical protein AB1K56_17940 [Microbacterium sp. BWR-S6Y]|uniref:hypothetical protein n=1 Tax=Microbacterium sp. BWR-S6Y TaxID=3232073 RepID=UPI00352872EE